MVIKDLGDQWPNTKLEKFRDIGVFQRSEHPLALNLKKF